MTKENRYDKIQEIASKKPSGWKENAYWRKENEAWLDRSFEIALKILDVLEEKKWTQKKFAKKLGVAPQQVSKIIKGKQNLTLSTISKIEEVLEIKLIQISSFSFSNSYVNIFAKLSQEILKSSSFLFEKNGIITNYNYPYQDFLFHTSGFSESIQRVHREEPDLEQGLEVIPTAA